MSNIPSTDVPTKPSRQLQHHRRIDCYGYQRDDGLWDLEVTLNDTKSHPIPNKHRKIIQAGEPIHGMLLCVTVDIDLCIHEVEVRMHHTPYSECQHIEKAYQQVVGMIIKPGFYRHIKTLFYGAAGCTHITEMWRVLGTLAYQTTFSARATQNLRETSKALLGTCHVHATEEKVSNNISDFDQN